MDRDIERIIRGMFAVYRIVKKLRKAKDAKTKKLAPVQPIKFPARTPRPEPLDEAIDYERRSGWAPGFIR